jgi:hypothetical protein
MYDTSYCDYLTFITKIMSLCLHSLDIYQDQFFLQLQIYSTWNLQKEHLKSLRSIINLTYYSKKGQNKGFVKK